MPTTRDTAIAGSAIDDLPQIWDGFAKLVRSGQQELYVALRGAGAVVAGERRLPLDAEHLVRVDAGVDRVLTSGPEGLRVLCVGGVPGEPYVAPEWTV